MKIKFPIILKIALLGILISGIATGVAVTISYINQTNRSKTTLINNIDRSLYGVDYTYTQIEESEDLVEQLKAVKEYVENIYTQPDVHEKTVNDFETFEEYEEYFQKRAVWIFPDPNMMIGSQAYFTFRDQYRELTHILSEAHLSSGGRAAYVAYKDKTFNGEDRFVFINDTRIANPNSRGDFYHLPGSHYTLKDSDYFVDRSDEDYYGYVICGYLTRLVPIYETVGEEKVEIAEVFIEYDLNELVAQDKAIMLNELLIISIVMVVTVGLYMLISHFAITRNLNRLVTVTEKISSDLKEKKNIVPSNIKINSHDEIASLTESFGIMEQEIVNYIEIIKKEAKENERREAELEVASSIQLGALPNKDYQDENLRFAAFIKPAKVVGGDFYDYFYNKDEFVVIIADVSGKGISAAMFMMKAKTLLKTKILSGLSLVDAVKEANNELTVNNEMSLFVTAFVASINYKKNEMRYVNAGHEKPYILHRNEVIKLDGTSNFVLGGEEGFIYKEEKISFENGDLLFTFTDGLNESINKDEEEFGYQRIVETLSESKDLSLENILSSFNEKLKEFVQEEEQFDDITMIALKKNDDSLHLSYKEKDYALIEDATNKFNDTFFYLNSETKAYVGIVLDELLNNLITYEAKEDLEIDVDFEYKNQILKLTITSNGADYNPFENHKEKYLKEDNGDISPGGFGILLVKNSTKTQEHYYRNNKSVIILTF